MWGTNMGLRVLLLSVLLSVQVGLDVEAVERMAGRNALLLARRRFAAEEAQWLASLGQGGAGARLCQAMDPQGACLPHAAAGARASAGPSHCTGRIGLPSGTTCAQPPLLCDST